MTDHSQRRRGRRRGVLWAYLTGAALLHALLLPSLGDWWQGRAAMAPTPRHPPMLLSSSAYSPARAAELSRAQAARRQAQARKQPQPQPPEALPRGQVVDLPPSPDNRAPEAPSRYLAEHNSRVDKESRSRHAAPHYRNVLNEPSVASKDAPERPRRGAPAQAVRRLYEGAQRPTGDGEALGGRLLVPRTRAQERLALRLDPDLGHFANKQAQPRIDGNSDHLDLAAGEPAAATEGGEALSLGDLVPSIGTLARLDGGPTNDALPSVDLGEGTFLNAREFKYASFFNRLKRSVAERWDPLSEVQRRDPTGNIYGWRARTTTVDVSLDLQGSLQHALVRQSSGVDFLDREAVAAFERAAPFPNPPRGLQGPRGTIEFLFNFQIDFQGMGGRGPQY